MSRDFSITVEIDAPKERVWAVMSDVERWAEWTPSVKSIERLVPGPLAVSSRLNIRQPKFPPTIWTVTAMGPGHSLTLKAGSPGVWVIARHWVEPSPNGCRATLSLRFDGVFGGIVGRLTKRLSEQYLQYEATGLKRRSESSVA